MEADQGTERGLRAMSDGYRIVNDPEAGERDRGGDGAPAIPQGKELKKVVGSKPFPPRQPSPKEEHDYRR